MVLVNAYVQVDFNDAYLLLDKQGLVAHSFRSEFPQATFGIRGELLLGNNDSKIRQLKISTTQIWIHVELPDSFQFIVDQAVRLIDSVGAIVSVESYKRLGMRLECVLPVTDLEQAGFSVRDKFLRDDVIAFMNTRDKDGKGRMDLLLEWFSGELKIDLRLRQVRRKLPTTGDLHGDIPEQGFMLDFDIGQEQEDLPLQRLRTFFREATAWAGTEIPIIGPVVLPELN